MNTIMVNKQELLDALTANRAVHRGKVTKSREGYREKIIKELDKRLAEAKRGRDIDPGFLHRLPIPRDFTEEYDRAIDQVQREVRDEIELGPADFNRYFRDEWEWLQAFATSNASYL